MLKQLIFSFKKSNLLSKIASQSTQKVFDSPKNLNSAINKKVQVKTLGKRKLYLEQLLSLLSNDKLTTNLLATHGKNLDDVRKIIKKLETNGAGQIVKGHYVPISSIAFLPQLRIILKYWDGENFKIENLDSYNSNLKMANHLVQSF